MNSAHASLLQWLQDNPGYSVITWGARRKAALLARSQAFSTLHRRNWNLLRSRLLRPPPTAQEMNTMTTPTPPAGYKLVKGEDIKDRVPEGALIWSSSQSLEDQPEWVPSGRVCMSLYAPGQLTAHYAIPETKPEPVIPEIGPQPPIETEPSGVEAEVCRDISERQRKGVAKYGTTVAENPLELREWLQHAYEETLDKAIYLKRAIWQLSKENGDGLERAIELLREEKRKRDSAGATSPA